MSAAATDLVARFLDEGYAIVEDVFDPADGFRACRGEWSAILDRIENGLPAAAGESTFDQRLTAACAAAGGDILQAFDISLPQREIRTDTPLNVGPAMFALITDERLLDIVEELVGPEILSSPVQHVRFKTPNGAARDGDRPSYLSAAVPWHQDLGVLLPEADESSILSCWIAVTDADEENGCLQVVPRSHRLPLLEHCPAGQVAIPDRLVSLAEARSLPMRAGSVLLFGQNLVHSSLENTSRDRVRISVDLRYQRPDEPTGRPEFPGFLARSRAHPDRVLRDPSVWAGAWHAARARLATDATPTFNRWDTDSPACA